MAKKILIIDDGSHMKKSAVEALTRRLLMFWVIPGVSATRQKLKHFSSALRAPKPIPELSGVPDRLPPFELPGIKFIDSRTSLINRQSSNIARYQWGGRSRLEILAAEQEA